MFSIIQAAGWPIWPLLACSVLALAVVIERFMSLRPHHVAPPKLADEAILVSRYVVPSTDIVLQLEQNSLLGRVLASGLRALSKNPRLSEDDLRSALEGAGREAAHELERYMASLATIASAAPLLGLLGTVIGMIEIFGSQGAGMTGADNPAQLAHGISIALYNTAFGLIVAIPSLIFWRYFRGRVDAYVLQMELAAERFARHLNTLRKPAGGAFKPAPDSTPMKFRQRSRDEPEINLIPFIDVLLVVLIFLMLSTTFSKFTQLQVQLPVANTEAARNHPREVIVAVSSDGRYAVNKAVLNGRGLEALAAALKAASAAGPDTVLIISADAAASHQSVVLVMEAARRAGLSHITFATQSAPAASKR